jgi:hypothetical protein
MKLFTIENLLLLSILLSCSVIDCTETAASGLAYNFLSKTKNKIKKSKVTSTLLRN